MSRGEDSLGVIHKTAEETYHPDPADPVPWVLRDARGFAVVVQLAAVGERDHRGGPEPGHVLPGPLLGRAAAQWSFLSRPSFVCPRLSFVSGFAFSARFVVGRSFGFARRDSPGRDI